MLEIFVLGQFSLRIDSELILIPSRPAQSLFAYLALNPGMIQRRERLAGMLWPEATEQNARGYLRSALWRIRKTFEELRHPVDAYLHISDVEIRFIKEADYNLDANEILEHREFKDWTIEQLKHVVGLFQGELLPGFYDEWVVLERERIHSAYELKNRMLLDMLLEARRFEEVLEWSERWIAQGYAPEAAYRASMLAQAGMHDISSAIAVYRRAKESLSIELGVEPSQDLRELRDQLEHGKLPEPLLIGVDVGPLFIEDQPPYPGEAPYKGLEFFSREDADLFHGREELTASLIGHLRENINLVFVVGASGSGKSSIIRAGLIPSLIRGKKLPDGTDPPSGSSDWVVHILTPGAHPLESLALSLANEGAPISTVRSVLEEMSQNPRTLQMIAKRMADHGSRILLVIDQLEEVFTLCREEEERKSFIENLMTAADPANKAPVTLVLALRADFYARCSDYPQLRLALARHQEYIGAMHTEDLRRAIEQPARLGGWTFQPGLVELLIRDVRDEPGALPLLSHALLETWRRRSGTILTLKGYAESGGVHGAIARTAERVYRDLGPQEKQLARNIFLRLTELGEGTQDTRRRASIDELIPSPEMATAVQDVLQILAQARLVTLSKNNVEVAHEALIREWPTLRGWLEQDRENLILQRHLTDSAQEWAARGEDASDLYRGARLASALEWAQANPHALNLLERRFLDVSRRAEEENKEALIAQREREIEAARKLAEAEKARAEVQEKSASRLRAFAFGLSLMLIFALIAAAFALQQRNRANREATLARSRELAVASRAESSTDPEEAIIIALQAVKLPEASGLDIPREAQEALHYAVMKEHTMFALRGHSDRVYTTIYSPDGNLIATTSHDGTIRIWDARNGLQKQVLQANSRIVMDAAFFPDIQKLVTVHFDRVARVWDLEQGDIELTLDRHDDRIASVAVSPDGSIIATGGTWDALIKIWDAATGDELHTLSGHYGWIFDLSFSPDGRYLASAGTDGILNIWDLETRQVAFSLDNAGLPFLHVDFSPDGTLMASSGVDSTISIWHTDSFELDKKLIGHSGMVSIVQFNPTGSMLASAGSDHLIRIWDVATGIQTQQLSGSKSAIWGLNFNPGGDHLVSGGDDGVVRVWDLGLENEMASLRVTGGVSAIAYHPATQTIAVGLNVEGNTVEWNTSSGKIVRSLQTGGEQTRTLSLAYSTDGSLLASGSADGCVNLWDSRTGELSSHLGCHDGEVNDVEFSPQGDYIASAGSDDIVNVWDTASGELVQHLAMAANAVTALSFSPQGKYLASGDDSGGVYVWDLTSATEPITRIAADDSKILSIAFSEDDTQLLSASFAGNIGIWNIADGTLQEVLQEHNAPVLFARYLPAGEQIVAVGADGMVILFDPEQVEPIAVIENSEQAVFSSAALSSDGQQIAVGGSDGIRVMLLDMQRLSELATDRLARIITRKDCEESWISDCEGFYEVEVAQSVEGDARPTICQAVDQNGVYDRFFNHSVYVKMQTFASSEGWPFRLDEATMPGDEGRIVRNLSQSNCDLIVAYGTFLSTHLEDAAEGHPDISFLSLDYQFSEPHENIWTTVYAVEQPAFLAGYVAASVSKTGKVGTFGGMYLPPVLNFMVGFERGVQYYNQVHDADVEVLGWDSDEMQGEFVGDFCCYDEGYHLGTQMLDQGADVILSVAGDLVGEGVAQAVSERDDAYMIGVDTDLAVLFPQYSSIALTSVVKDYARSVQIALDAFAAGDFQGGPHTGTLETGEVGLAPFHENEGLISEKTLAELETLRMKIIQGDIKIP